MRKTWSTRTKNYRRVKKGYKSLWYISTVLHQYVNMDDLISQIIQKVSEVMDAEDVLLMFYDQNDGKWVCCRADDEPGHIINTKERGIPSDHQVAAQVFETGIPVIFPAAPDESSNSHPAKVILPPGDKSMIAVPLKTKERIIGVLEVINRADCIFDNRDLFFLSTLAPILAIALDNAAMYAQLHNEYQELRVADQMKDHLIAHTREENIHLRKTMENRYQFDQITGYSDRMLEVFRLCEKVMDSDITVLVEGETGTGKELIARCIHNNSPRKHKLFVSQNCAGVPDTLLASELFGHKKGAFTGAVSDKKGLFEIANGGTVFFRRSGGDVGRHADWPAPGPSGR